MNGPDPEDGFFVHVRQRGGEGYRAIFVGVALVLVIVILAAVFFDW